MSGKSGSSADTVAIDDFLAANLRKSGRFVPARVQAALALLERLRDFPTLKLSDHKKDSSSGLYKHERWGKRARKRLLLENVNKNDGRRSNDVADWGPRLLDRLGQQGFESKSPTEREQLIDSYQARLAVIIREIVEAEPIEARVKGRSAESVLREVLKQADEKGKAGDVAQYLVGAKLMLRLGRDIDVVPANKGDRKARGDTDARIGDYDFEGVTIEVAAGMPDEKHLSQVEDALEDSDLQIWLLTRHDRIESWQSELEKLVGANMKRVVVGSIEAFVGQNMTEMGEFTPVGTAAKLQELFDLYNERWVAAVGTPAICIVVK